MAKGHKSISIREDSYKELSNIASMLQLRDGKRTSFCEVIEWLVRQAPKIEVPMSSRGEFKVVKR